MVFQDPMTSFNPVYRIGDQIVEAIRAHRTDVSRERGRERAVELLDSVGIPNAERRVDDYPHEFSGGMRQRAMIAMALALEPEVLIADEPTTALDVTIQAQILDLLGGAQPRARPGDDPDHPRPRRRRRSRRPGAGHVRGAGGRGGNARRDLLRPPASLHLGPARLADPDRPAAPPAPAADQRRAALAARPSPPGCAFRPRCPHAFDALRRASAASSRGSRRRPAHRDRCWLTPEQKRERRQVEGRIGLEEPA